MDEKHNIYDGDADKPTTDEKVLNTNLQASDVVDNANTFYFIWKNLFDLVSMDGSTREPSAYIQ